MFLVHEVKFVCESTQGASRLEADNCDLLAFSGAKCIDFFPTEVFLQLLLQFMEACLFREETNCKL